MMAALFLAVLILEAILLSRLDRKRFGTWATPFTLLAYPYTIIALLAYFLAPILDFAPLYSYSVLVWIIGLLVLWAAGTFLGWGLLDIREESNAFRGSEISGNPRLSQFATRLAWIISPVLLYGVMISARASGGLSQIGTLDFKVAYSHGIPGHAVVLATLLVVLLIGIYEPPHKFQLLTITMLFIFLLLNQVKGTILQSVIGGMLFRMMRGGFRLSWKKLGGLVFFTYLGFNVVYMIGMFLVSPDDAFNGTTYSYLGRHYFFYLFSGPLALGESMRSGTAAVGGPWFILFAPFINAYQAILGGGNLVLSGSTHEKGMATDFLADANLDATNVYTFFGTPYLYLGVLGAILYVAIVGLLCYGFMLLVRRKQEAWLTAGYCFIAAQLSLGFFELYFWSSTSYEIIAMATVLFYCTTSSRRAKDKQRLPLRNPEFLT